MKPVEALTYPLGRLLRSRRADESLSPSHWPILETEGVLTLESLSWGDGEEIPAAHCGFAIGENISPELSWSPGPEGTKTYLLFLEDIDAPQREPGIHTAVVIPASVTDLPEASLSDKAKASSLGVIFVPTVLGLSKYSGPRPLPGHGAHRYRFHIYALDFVPEGIDLQKLKWVLDKVKNESGKVLAHGALQTFRRDLN